VISKKKLGLFTGENRFLRKKDPSLYCLLKNTFIQDFKYFKIGQDIFKKTEKKSEETIFKNK
jgi:hypothetical protein